LVYANKGKGENGFSITKEKCSFCLPAFKSRQLIGFSIVFFAEKALIRICYANNAKFIDEVPSPGRSFPCGKLILSSSGTRGRYQFAEILVSVLF